MVNAYRGENKISEDELKAYLASLMRLENVGVLLGSGASADVGGMTMKGTWKHFEKKCPKEKKWLEKEKFIESRSEKYTVLPFGKEIDYPNLEELLDTLAISIAEWRRVEGAKLKDARDVRAAIYRSLVEASKLNDTWWQNIEDTDPSKKKLGDHKKMLQRLSSSRQPGQSSPWIFTTNYDLAVEWAADSIDLSIINGFLGLHSRKFAPQSFDLGYRNVQARGEARFGAYNIYLAKLHGSLTWKEIDGQFYEIQAHEAWRDIQEFMEGNCDKPPFTVMPSAAKYVQTIGLLLGELFRRFAEFLNRPQTVLVVCGYGFGDEHVNRLLASAFLNPTFQLVIYFPGFKKLSEDKNLPLALQRLIDIKSPRVTIVGDADFRQFVNHLPDPVIYEEDLKGIEKKLNSSETRHES